MAMNPNTLLDVTTTLNDWDDPSGERGAGIKIHTEIEVNNATLTFTMPDGKRHQIYVESDQGVLAVRAHASATNIDDAHDGIRDQATVIAHFGPNTAFINICDQESHNLVTVDMDYKTGVTQHCARAPLTMMESRAVLDSFKEKATKIRENIPTYEIRAYKTQADYDNLAFEVIGRGLVHRDETLHEANKLIGNYEIVTVIASQGDDVVELRTPAATPAADAPMRRLVRRPG
jgi:hypothetical protein